jgi:hypothetical protein
LNWPVKEKGKRLWAQGVNQFSNGPISFNASPLEESFADFAGRLFFDRSFSQQLFGKGKLISTSSSGWPNIDKLRERPKEEETENIFI